MAEYQILTQVFDVLGRPEVLVGSVPLITVTADVTLYPFETSGRIAPGVGVFGKTELYPFTTAAYIVRPEFFESLTQLYGFQTSARFNMAKPVTVRARADEWFVKGLYVPVRVETAPTRSLFGDTELYAFTTSATVFMPIGFSASNEFAPFQSMASALVEKALRGNTELYGFQTKSIVLVPPIVTRFTPELHPFQTTSLISIPYRLAISNSLYAFETDTFVNLSNLFNGSGDLSEFESVLRVSPPANLTAVTYLGDFITKASLQNNATASVSADQILPDFEVVVDAVQTLYVNGSWIVAMPTLTGSMDQGALLLEGVMNAPLPTVYGLLSADKSAFELDGLLIAPMPSLVGAVSLSYRISSLLVAPAPFIRGRLKKAATPGTAGSRGSRPFIGISLNR